jgi:hypothetical protein
VFVDGLARPWYRDELLHDGVDIGDTPMERPIDELACDAARSITSAGRAVVVDARVRALIGTCVSAVSVGLTSRVSIEAAYAATPDSVTAAQGRLAAFAAAAPIDSSTDRWPNNSLGDAYLSALIATSNDAARAGATEEQLQLLNAALRYRDDATLRAAVATIEQQAQR